MRSAVALLCALAFLCAPHARAQENLRLAEQAIKVGLIYNFLHYTRWPLGEQSGALRVCVFGADPFAGRLEPIATRTVAQHAIEVRRTTRSAELRSCALVFITASQQANWPLVRAELTGRPILTVSDFAGFANEGGMIEFTQEGQRIGMRINSVALAESHLSMEDRLLRLADLTGGRRP